MILEEYAHQLPAALRRRMEESIAKAVEGERKEGRLKETYTKHSLMYGFLRTWGRPAPEPSRLGHRGPTMVRRHVHKLFKKNGTSTIIIHPPTMASIFTDSRCGVSMGRPRPSRRWASRWKRIYGRMLPPTITPT